MATAVQKFKGDANRRQVIQLRSAGHRLDDIAERLGMTESGVRYHLDAWLAAQKPSAEQTEELRQVQAAQVDALTAKLQAMLDSDDYLAVTDRLVKLMDRKARLMGLDLERSVSVNVVPTAETLAALFGWDGSAPAIDVEAVEVTDAS